MTPYLTQSPTARTGAAMAFDANGSDQYVVMFGGEGANGPLGDTWTYRAGVWTNVTPNPINATNSPPARFGASMAYDASDGYVLLFGGATGPNGGSSSPLLNDTWEFEHGNWTEICAACGPSPRVYAGATSLSPAAGVLLFGGLGISGGTFESFADTWSFSAGVWSSIASSTSPAPRFDPGLSVDPTLGEPVLFGGCARSLPTPLPTCASVLNDTWGYSGGTWTDLASGSSTTPPGRWAAGFESGPVANGPLLFGGESATGLVADTWEEESGTWNDLTSVVLQSPSPRSNFAFAWDNASGDDYIVLFGGTNGTLLNETWVYPSPFNPLRVSAPAANRTELDATTQLVLTVTVAGGAGKNAITWFGLPSGCSSANATKVTCRPGTPSGMPTSSSVVVRVRDKIDSIVWSAATTVVVNPIPTVAISGSPTNVGVIPLSITLDATTLWGTPPFAFAWLLGDGTNATGATFVHTYTKIGKYELTVWANDSSGLSIDAHYAVQAVGRLLTVLQVGPSGSVSAGTSVTFDAHASGGVTPYAFSWSGLPPSCTPQNSAVISCSVSVAGSYAVKVNVSDFRGNYSVGYANLTVTAAWYSSPYLWAGVIAVAVVVVAVAAVVWIRRRRRGKSPASAPAAPAGPPAAPPPSR